MRHVFGEATIYEGNVYDGLREIPAGSVNAVVTSPPYWRLRSYLADDHELKPLELGSERTPEEFVRNLVQVFQVLRPALADHGVVFVNLGETYNAYNGNRGKSTSFQAATEDACQKSPRGLTSAALKNKDRCGIPERFALAMQSDGWYWRDTIIWRKPSPMPMSFNGWRWERCRVKVGRKKWVGGSGTYSAGESNFDGTVPEWSDCPGCKKCTPNEGYVLRKGSFRTTPNYEPIFMFAKTANYFCDREAVAEPAAESTKQRLAQDVENQTGSSRQPGKTNGNWKAVGGETRNPRSIWTIGPDNYKGEHYAAYPRELPEKCLRMAMSNKGYCVTCGMPWARVVNSEFIPQQDVSRERGINGAAGQKPNYGNHDGKPRGTNSSKTIGWRPTCQCTNNTPQPGLVCDPFTGTGTTAEVALKLGHLFFGCELNPVYVDQIRERLTGGMPLFC